MSARIKTSDGKQKAAKKKIGIGEKQVFDGRISKFDTTKLPKIKEMYENGAFAVDICAELGICRDTMRRWCIKDGEHYHPEFAKVIGIGRIVSECYWFKKRNEENPKIWQYIMKNQFGWSNVPQRSNERHNIKVNVDSPDKTMDEVLKKIIDGSMSLEKGKVLVDLLINSYNVRNISEQACIK